MSAPQRLVSLVPSTTETVCAFGAAARLVGCTRYCTEPPQALREVARVGGTKNPDREAIMRLAPDLVLTNAEENRAEDIAWLTERVAVLTQTPCDVAAALGMLRELARTLHCEAAASPFVQRIEQLVRGRVEPRSPLRAYYAIWRKPWMSVGRATFVHDVLTWVGAMNVCADDVERYPAVPPADAVARGVDVVLLASEPWEFDEAQRQQLVAERTFGDARLVLCDGRDFCWHGVRMAAGLGRAADLLRSLG